MIADVRAHGSHSELSTIEALDDLDDIRNPRDQMIKHLLDVADWRQILAEVLDGMTDLSLHLKRLDS